MVTGTITFGNKIIGSCCPVFIIAEAGVNHDGDLGKAKKLVDIAIEAGVDAVKFQTWKTESLILPGTSTAAYQKQNTGEKSQFAMIKKFELAYEDFRALKKYCGIRGILFLSTPDEQESADFLNTLGMPCFKIGSGELNNPLLLKHIALFGKPIILSTGMSTITECRKARDVIFSAGNHRLIMLHCTTDYPTLSRDVNLNALTTLEQEMNKDTKHPVFIGYSDHTLGLIASIVAVARGAVIIEKHFTYDKTAQGPDHKASLNPEELKELVRTIRTTETMLGSPEKKPTSRELETKNVMRKLIVAQKHISLGKIITEGDITTKRASGVGFSADQYELVLGHRAKKDIAANEILSKHNLDNCFLPTT